MEVEDDENDDNNYDIDLMNLRLLGVEKDSDTTRIARFYLFVFNYLLLLLTIVLTSCNS